MTADYVLVTTLTDKALEARRLAENLVHMRLAASAHVDEIESTYRWKSTVERRQEWRIQFTTVQHRVAKIQEQILETLSTDTPQIIVTPILGGLPAHLQWITNETTPLT